MSLEIFQIVSQDLFCPLCNEKTILVIEDESAKVKKIECQVRKNKICLKFYPTRNFHHFNHKSLSASICQDETQKFTKPLLEALSTQEFYFTLERYCSNHYTKLYLLHFDAQYKQLILDFHLEEVKIKSAGQLIELSKIKKHFLIQTYNIDSLRHFYSYQTQSLELDHFPLQDFNLLINKIKNINLLS